MSATTVKLFGGPMDGAEVPYHGPTAAVITGTDGQRLQTATYDVVKWACLWYTSTDDPERNLAAITWETRAGFWD